MTDIEGSTRLWEERPRAMALALARHDELAKQTFELYEGQIIKARGEGDSLFVAFTTASSAIAGAIAFGAALQNEEWPDGISLRVRQAIHTGEAINSAGDYYGPTINRCARLRAAGHGGQILLSGATKSVVAARLPGEVSLRFLGTHRLKDLQDAEEIWQVVADVTAPDFPPLRTWTEAPNNLPKALTSFIGRAKALADVAALLAKHSIVTLTGTGGAGKTRLSIECARLALTDMPDGVWLVELADISDPDQIPRAIQAALNLPAAASTGGILGVVEAIRDQRLLIVLDNCEHVLHACANVAEAILQGAPNVKILATSREATGAHGEAVLRIPSLAIPDEKTLDPTELAMNEAVALFLDRATAQAPNFTLTQENSKAVIQICRNLDGIPLALELAAARIRALQPQELANRLEDRFRLLTGAKGGRSRHQTLHATIEWSYRLLTDLERDLFAQLSVFTGGWSLALAERVCGGDIDEFDVLDLLTALIDKSLVSFEASAEGRYSYPESIRAFSRDQLAMRTEDQTAVRERHVSAMATFCMEKVMMQRTADEPIAVEQLVREGANILAAFNQSRTMGDPNRTAQLALGLSASRRRRGYQRNAVPPVDEALFLGEGVLDPLLKAKLLCERAGLALDLLSSVQAGPMAREAADLAHAHGDTATLIRAENLLGQVALEELDYATTRAHYQESLRLSELGDSWIEAARLRNNLGILERRDPNGDKDLAAQHYEAALAIQRSKHDLRGEAETLNSYGVLEYSRANYPRAAEHYLASGLLESKLEHRFGVAKTLSNYGEAWLDAGEAEKAVRPLATAEQFFIQIQSPYRDFTSGLLGKAVAMLGWTPAETEDFRAECAAVDLEVAVTLDYLQSPSKTKGAQ